jgi:branched-chain amino acid transport system ATP-binding protein
MSPDTICKLGLVRTWQKVRPLAKLNALDNVVVGALLRAPHVPDARKLAMEQLDRVRLAHHAKTLAGVLSIGDRKKLEVARVLATGPTLLLLDEVLGGLNPAESEELITLMLSLKKSGLTQLIIEHDMKAIMRISDRVVVLTSGEKLAEGTPQEVAQNPAVVAAYLGDALAEG